MKSRSQATKKFATTTKKGDLALPVMNVDQEKMEILAIFDEDSFYDHNHKYALFSNVLLKHMRKTLQKS